MATSQTDSVELPDRIRAHALASGRPRVRLRLALSMLGLLAIVAWSFHGTEVSLVELITSAPNMWRLLTRMWPPDWAYFTSYDRVIEPSLVTIQLAISSTIIAVILALPLSLLAARNLAHPLLYQSVRIVLNILRSIPELVYGLIFVSAVGLGPFAGTLALVAGSVGSIAKVFAESIEAINPKPVEAMEAVGASRLQQIAFAVFPQAQPNLVSYGLLYWEHNIRASFIVGAVGGGGLGFEIVNALNLFQYQEFAVLVIIVIVLVTLADRLSAWVRGRLT